MGAVPSPHFEQNVTKVGHDCTDFLRSCWGAVPIDAPGSRELSLARDCRRGVRGAQVVVCEAIRLRGRGLGGAPLGAGIGLDLTLGQSGREVLQLSAGILRLPFDQSFLLLPAGQAAVFTAF